MRNGYYQERNYFKVMRKTIAQEKNIAQYLIAIAQYFSVLETNSGADLNQNSFVLRRLGCKMLTEI